MSLCTLTCVRCLIFIAVLAVEVSGFDRPTRAQELWDTTKPRGQTREIDFTTSEGTWMSVDISPDARWVVFDLLSQIYRVPVEGGEAQCLTVDSGVAENFHPRYSPDGKHIAFVTDRKGGENLWIMNADGSNPRPVFTDKNVRVFEPTWTPDGKYIIVRRHHIGEGLYVESGLWIYPANGGGGIQLVGPGEIGRYIAWPSVSPDERYVYFEGCTGETTEGCTDVVEGGHQLWRLEQRANEIDEVTTGPGGAMSPEISPDGRWLAFARRIPDGTISFKDHKFSPRTALWLRDMQTGAERVVMDPIEVDLAERQLGARAVFHAERVLPGYSWARDGKSIVISQGGKLRRLWVENGKVETIPFTAHVHRTISEQVYSPLPIPDGSFEARMLRWYTASPDGSKLAFQAVGKIWIQALPEGTPQRLTPDSFEPFELSPAWSPDGQWIAFTTEDDKGNGHVWKVSARGGTPQQVSRQGGEYLNPVWSPDGRQIVLTRGSGASARGGTTSDNPWYELVSIPLSGGPAQLLARVNPPRSYYSGGQIWQASFGPEGRIFYPDSRAAFATESQRRVKRVTQFSVSDAAGLRPWQGAFGGAVTELISIKPNGSDKRVHMEFPYATAAAPSPDGKWVTFQEGDNVYLTPLAWNGNSTQPLRVDRRLKDLPIRQLSTEGGLYPRWRDATTVEFGSGNNYFAYHTDSQRIDSTKIHLRIPRNLPKGTIALTGARIITLENRKVIEKGAIVVKGGRITCVGECSTAGVDRIIDARGKTIIPGWVDMHAHHHGADEEIIHRRDSENAVYLAYGVTTTLDPWAWSQEVFADAELIEAGVLLGPRTFSTGIGIWSGDSPYHNEIKSYEDAEHELKRLSSWGAVAVKQYTLPHREQHQWVVEGARKLGLRVTAEGEDSNYDLGMIMDGQTGFEHNAGYVPLYNDVTRFFGLAKAVYSATLMVVGPGLPWGDQYFRQESEVWKDEKQRDWLPSMSLMLTRRRPLRPVTDYPFPILAQGMADIIAAGGYGAVGSHGQQHGIGSHWDVWIMESAMGSMGALEVASLHGAHFLGAENDIGSIEVGKLADLMILNSNPLDNIRNTADMKYVMKAGTLYDAKTLDEIWPEQKPFGEHNWVNPDVLRGDSRPVNYWDLQH